jgi:tetratricopeptide (TPR) repeat protein/CheY-like chemotaxis protein
VSAELPTVLLIDPRDRSRRLLEHGLRKEGVEVTACATAEEALAAEPMRWSVVVVDPAGERGALLAVVEKIPSVARRPLIAIASEDEIAACEQEGARTIVLRPARIRDLAPLVRTLALEPDETLPTSAPVNVTSEEFTRDQLVELLDTIVLEERTGAIRVQGEGVIGTLYFRAGELVDAVAGRVIGQAAVNRLLYIDGGRYEALYVDELERERTIEGSASDVLQDAEEYAEEFRALAARLPSLDRIYSVSLRSISASSSQLPPETDLVVRQIDGRRTVREVVFSSPVDDFVSLQVLCVLFEMGALVEDSEEEDEDAPLDDGFEQLRLSGAFRAISDPAPAVQAEAEGRPGRSALVVGSPRGFTGAHRAITGSEPAIGEGGAAAAEAVVRAAAAHAEQAAAAERAVAAERAAAAAERARAESARRTSELDALLREEEELAAARRAEIAEAERQAEALRRDAEDRAARLAEQEAEIARKRLRLSGALPAISASSAPTGATTPDDGRTMGLSSVAVATGATAAAPTASASRTLTDLPAVGDAPAAEPADDAFLKAAGGAETDFFTSDHDLAALDDPFAEPESEGPGRGLWIIGGVILVAIVLVVVFGSDSSTRATTPSTPTASTPSETAGDEADPVADEALPTETEGTAAAAVPVDPPAAPTADELAGAEAERVRRARETTATDSMLIARDLMSAVRDVSLDLAVLQLPTLVDPDPPQEARERRERDPEREAERDAERERRRAERQQDDGPASATTSRDLERVNRECALASSGGNYQRTITLCEEAVRADSRNPESLIYLGKAHFELGNSRQAIGYLEQALRVSSRNRTALVLLGAARQDVGDVSGAREMYERYLQLYPDGSRSNEIRRILESL